MDEQGGGRRFWVTCYADASFTRRGAAWAVWLRSEEGRLVRRGPCPAYVKGSIEAELAAVFAGVYLARKTWGAAVRGVYVRTDCQAIVGMLQSPALRPRVARSHPGLARLWEKVRAFAAEHAIELDLRWVRGHQKGGSTQAWLNRQCDALAGVSRKEAEGKAADAQPARRREAARRRRRRRW